MQLTAMPPEIRNVHLVQVTGTPDPTVTRLRTTSVDFAPPAGSYGGTDAMSTMVDGKTAGIRLTAFLNRPAERAGAQALLDAIRASGLLTAQLPGNDWRQPPPGHSRLYLDRRSRYVEFETANPPLAVRAVLAAIDGYLQVAR